MNPSPLPPAATLDPDAVASTLLRVVMLSAQLGHSSPQCTARDYLTTVDVPEARFVRDVLSRSTEEICDEWFGGTIHAATTLMGLRQDWGGE